METNCCLGIAIRFQAPLQRDRAYGAGSALSARSQMTAGPLTHSRNGLAA